MLEHGLRIEELQYARTWAKDREVTVCSNMMKEKRTKTKYPKTNPGFEQPNFQPKLVAWQCLAALTR